MSTPEEFKAAVGTEIAVSDWIELTQEDERAFGTATFLDAERLGGKVQPYIPYGEDLISGFLLVGLLIHFNRKANPMSLEGGYSLNYGLDKVRFLQPVLAGQRIRDRITLQEFSEREPGQFRITTRNVIEVEGAEGPAMVADWLTYFIRADIDALIEAESAPR